MPRKTSQKRGRRLIVATPYYLKEPGRTYWDLYPTRRNKRGLLLKVPSKRGPDLGSSDHLKKIDEIYHYVLSNIYPNLATVKSKKQKYTWRQYCSPENYTYYRVLGFLNELKSEILGMHTEFITKDECKMRNKGTGFDYSKPIICKCGCCEKLKTPGTEFIDENHKNRFFNRISRARQAIKNRHPMRDYMREKRRQARLKHKKISPRHTVKNNPRKTANSPNLH